MFKKLNRRLLTLNMVSISLLLAIAFVSIYFVTYSRTAMAIENTLNHLEGPKPNDLQPPDIYVDLQLDSLVQDALAQREVSFVINLDLEGNVLSSHSFFKAEPAFYSQALAYIQAHPQKKYMTLAGDKWAYRRIDRKDFQQVFFVEVTSQLDTLSKLAYTFILVFLLMIGLNYIFSSYMTQTAIKPIQKAFDKQNQFISDASHEIKTPLAVISTNVDVLLAGSQESDKWLTYIKAEVTAWES